ncbi:MAG: M48 family metalloprotease, partial [Desulfotignum sp.]
ARSKIEAVCEKAGLRYADILKWDLFAGAMITAGVMGLVGRYRYILVTPALVQSLDDQEMEAVMLHEIGHVHHHHMLFYLFFFAGFIACN